MGSKGIADRSGRREEWSYRLLSGSPCLVWVVVAALLFSALWDGAGSAGAALFQTECSTNLPLGRLGCAGVQTTSGTPLLIPFPGLEFRSILSRACGMCSSDFPEKDQS